MKLPNYYRNWLSLIGLLMAGINLALIIILFIISTIFNKGSSNLGIFIYIVLPGFLILGLILIPVGNRIRRKSLRKTGKVEEARYPRIDLNEPGQRKVFYAFISVATIFLLLSAMGSLGAYHVTETVEFCGTLCHKVMEPEYTAYRNSPHANVACVDCHVGSGASWYVKSKLSGLHQVYAVIANDYPRPIPTPIHDLRPARETCERCHWPAKFYPRTLVTNKYYLADSLNSEWDIMLQMKTGPEYASLGFTEGIHWHINPDVSIEYLSENDQREVITYVTFTNKKTGKVEVFMNPDTPVADSVINSQARRTMDCIDCHNRPSHKYSSPSVFFDKSMLAGRISKSLPSVKKVSMDILKQVYTTRDSAFQAIHDTIISYYSSNYKDIYSKDKVLIDTAIAVIQTAFSQNEFPRMKVTYEAYPDHIGHLETTGCFRCHNDAFRTAEGRVISRDCNLCHTIIGQGKPDAMETTAVRDTLEFRHPVDIGNAWKEANCSECHSSLY